MQGLIQQSFIDDLLNRIDIVEFIDSYVPLKKQGHNYVACCPFHHEKTPSFNVIPKKQFYHCFGCNAGGNAISFAMQYLQQPFPDAVITLATRAGLEVVYDKQNFKSNNLSLYQLLHQVAEYYFQNIKFSSKDAIAYIKHRGLGSDIVKQYQIGYAKDDWHALAEKFSNNLHELVVTGMLIKKDNGKTYDRYRNRLMFPIHDKNGKIIGFGGRVLDDTQKPKYLNSPETVLFQKSHELYGLYQVINSGNNRINILIVEGYMDVLSLVQQGINNVVATLGTSTSSYHIQLLSKYTKEIVFCFDGDKAGFNAAWRALESVILHLDKDLAARFVFLPEGQDPDTLIRAEGKESFLERINNAIPLHKFFFDSLLKDIDINVFSGKSKLISKAKPYLLKMADGAYKHLLVGELSRLTRIESHRILQLISEQSASPKNVRENNISRTPMRVAMAILLQHPEIYCQYEAELNSVKFDGNKYLVLRELMKQLSNNPKANTATLVELWRNTPLFANINELASWEHKVPEHALGLELLDIIFFLIKQDQENKIQQLIEKSRKLSLTGSEREELQWLLRKRHNIQQE